MRHNPKWQFSYWDGGRCKWYNIWQESKNDEGKEAECPDDTFTVDIGEGVSYRKDDKNEKTMRKKR